MNHVILIIKVIYIYTRGNVRGCDGCLPSVWKPSSTKTVNTFTQTSVSRYRRFHAQLTRYRKPCSHNLPLMCSGNKHALACTRLHSPALACTRLHSLDRYCRYFWFQTTGNRSFHFFDSSF